jgi:hypothetical protein
LALTVVHPFVSGVADSGDASLVQPGNWNANHTVTGTLAPATLITGSSGAANTDAAPSETWQRLSSNATTNSTSTIATVMTTTALPIGSYKFTYDILVSSAATSTSVKFSIDYTGTVTTILWHLFFPSQGVVAATGVVDQESNLTTGAVWAHQSTRIDNTTLGPMTDMDATTPVHMVAEGLLVVSTSADLVLGHASEVAAASTVLADTLLVLRRFA